MQPIVSNRHEPSSTLAPATKLDAVESVHPAMTNRQPRSVFAALSKLSVLAAIVHP